MLATWLPGLAMLSRFARALPAGGAAPRHRHLDAFLRAGA